VAAGSVNARWRFDEFDDVFLPLLASDEEHTIEFISEIGKHGFFANESIELRNPSTVSVIEDDTAAFVFTEVSKLTAPSTGEYRVSFDAEGFFNTGFIECNAADVGREVLLGYHGLGTINHPNFRLNRNFFLPGDVIVEASLTVDTTSLFTGDGTFSADLDVDGDLSTIGVSPKGIIAGRVVTAVDQPGAINELTRKDYVDARGTFSTQEVFTASGTFNVPANVSKIYIIVIGAGGGGLDGGAQPVPGGGSGERREGFLTVAPSAALTVTIGAAGTHGAPAVDGGDSIFETITSKGGGKGVSGGSKRVAGGTGGDIIFLGASSAPQDPGGNFGTPGVGPSGGAGAPSPEVGGIGSGGGGGTKTNVDGADGGLGLIIIYHV